MKRILPSVFLLMLLLCAFASAECLEIGQLTPIVLEDQTAGQIDLYFGPTQGFYREAGRTLDLAEPCVYFGQYDCWAMVAQGTPDAFGPVGWVEAGSLDALPYEPQLGFSDALPVMIEEDAGLYASPRDGEPLATLSRGEHALLLARYDDYGYVQAEIDGTPVRAFIPVSAIE